MAVEVQLFDDLDAVAAAAAGALDRTRQASLFDRLDWYRLMLAHCPLPGRPLIARARDGDTAVWLFLAADRRRGVALGSWYTLRFAAVRQGDAAALLPPLARALRRQLDRVTLAPLDEAEAHALAAAFRAAGWRIRLAPVSANWSIAIRAPDMAAYLAARPKKLRETLRRKGRAGTPEITIHTRFDPAAWDAYERVYRASWKPPEGSWPFLRALAEQEGAAGTLRLGIARDAAGAPVAAQLWLTEGGTATIHKLAHVETAKAGSPGTLLSAALFAHAIAADRVARIDFGTGDEPYKAEWMDHRAPLYRLDAYDPLRPAGLAALARATAAALVRRFRTR